MKSFDLVIIGGGICGMTAAIYAARANIRACILEQQVCGGLVNWTNTVENVPSYQSIHGIDLMEKCREHVESLNVAIEEVDKVTAVNFSGDIKKITTSMGEEYEAPAVIVATGRSPRPFPVETDFPNIHYCSVCDGTPYKGKDIIVMGGGNSGFDESLYLLGSASATFTLWKPSLPASPCRVPLRIWPAPREKFRSPFRWTSLPLRN